MRYKNKLNINYQIKSNIATYKEIDENSRIIKAVVNTYNFFDSDFDVLREGSAKRSIQNRGAKTAAHDKILHALNHDLHTLPGKSLSEAETTINGNKVLYAESFLPETTLGEDTLINYKAGIYNQHSIGFQYKDIEFIEKGTVEWDKFISNLINPEEADKIGFGYDVKEINWFEWSTVAFGVNKLTPYLGTKSQNKTTQLHNLYTKLDSLIKASKKGIKNKKIFELQYSQLKQMIEETVYLKPSGKETLKDSSDSDIKDNSYKQSTKKNFYLNLI